MGARALVTRLRARWLGRLPYDEAWDLQRALHEGRVEGRTPDDYLLLLEHPPVYTVGRFGDRANVLVPQGALEEAGAQVRMVDRGGDVTFHGPGQLVGYPIRHLGSRPAVSDHVRMMEEAIVAALGDLGIAARREPGLTGVWTDRGKIAAIGVRASRRVTTHGFAVNASTDLGWFGHINPCGITDRAVTSASEVLGRRVSIEETAEALLPRFAEAFGYRDVETQMAAFSRGTGRGSDDYEIDRLVAGGSFAPDRAGQIQITMKGRLPGEPEKPRWMKARVELGQPYRDLKGLVDGLDLHTVCQEASCPNIYECWAAGTATFMLLGDVCTRACSFCDVTTGRPGEVDEDEPRRVAEAIATMDLSHAVLTSVNRDDLPDGGAAVFARSIEEIRAARPGCEVEVLIPDFKGDPEALATVMKARPEVLNHNTETVVRLQRDIRTAASYGRSLALLWRARGMTSGGAVKSGLIVGMGESKDEVLGALADLRAVGVDIVTIGQYLRPTARHRPVDRYVHPDEFDEYAAYGREIGLPHVESGPLVRSSYHAREARAAAS
ncbi:MAG: lipoyl synthase [Actinobacteria bacterium]|nr:lipoyl synthase [Actinomycetota bacterium]